MLFSIHQKSQHQWRIRIFSVAFTPEALQTKLQSMLPLSSSILCNLWRPNQALPAFPRLFSWPGIIALSGVASCQHANQIAYGYHKTLHAGWGRALVSVFIIIFFLSPKIEPLVPLQKAEQKAKVRGISSSGKEDVLKSFLSKPAPAI